MLYIPFILKCCSPRLGKDIPLRTLILKDGPDILTACLLPTGLQHVKVHTWIGFKKWGSLVCTCSQQHSQSHKVLKHLPELARNVSQPDEVA